MQVLFCLYLFARSLLAGRRACSPTFLHHTRLVHSTFYRKEELDIYLVSSHILQFSDSPAYRYWFFFVPAWFLRAIPHLYHFTRSCLFYYLPHLPLPLQRSILLPPFLVCSPLLLLTTTWLCNVCYFPLPAVGLIHLPSFLFFPAALFQADVFSATTYRLRTSQFWTRCLLVPVLRSPFYHYLPDRYHDDAGWTTLPAGPYLIFLRLHRARFLLVWHFLSFRLWRHRHFYLYYCLPTAVPVGSLVRHPAVLLPTGSPAVYTPGFSATRSATCYVVPGGTTFTYLYLWFLLCRFLTGYFPVLLRFAVHTRSSSPLLFAVVSVLYYHFAVQFTFHRFATPLPESAWRRHFYYYHLPRFGLRSRAILLPPPAAFRSSRSWRRDFSR